MPIYEYICNDCSKSFARLQKIGTDSKNITCPTCQSTEVERTVSTFSGGAGGLKGSSAPSNAPSCSGYT